MHCVAASPCCLRCILQPISMPPACSRNTLRPDGSPLLHHMQTAKKLEQPHEPDHGENSIASGDLWLARACDVMARPGPLRAARVAVAVCRRHRVLELSDGKARELGHDDLAVHRRISGAAAAS